MFEKRRSYSTLTFNFTIDMGMESLIVWITLDVEGDTMKGQWETIEGDQGDIEHLNGEIRNVFFVKIDQRLIV
jgi:hypothetical protein